MRRNFDVCSPEICQWSKERQRNCDPRRCWSPRYWSGNGSRSGSAFTSLDPDRFMFQSRRETIPEYSPGHYEAAVAS